MVSLHCVILLANQEVPVADQSNNALKKLLHTLLLTAVCFLFMNAAKAQFIKGADIGWLPQMEASGYIFYDSTGTQRDCLEILKDHGINTLRLRVWVEPSNDRVNGHCSKKEVAALAVRAKNMGMRVMVDFHYSDTWADPGHQAIPSAWVNDNFNQLLDHLYLHTFQVLDTLKLLGVRTEWAQVGNEISSGMLWPEGSTSNWSQLGALLNKGYEAVKAVDSSTKVVLHLDQGNDNYRFRAFFDSAENHHVKYDIIGLSYYPYWLGTDYTLSVGDLGSNMDDISERYNKEVMVVETGGNHLLAQNTYDMLKAVMKKTAEVPNGKGLGVMYWEPEGEAAWSGYPLNCWGPDGKPTSALNAFLFNPLGVKTINSEQEDFFYPNPSDGKLLHLDLKKLSGLCVIRVLSVNGMLLAENSFESNSTIPLSLGLKPGIYAIQLNNKGNTTCRKLIVR
ncbi:MAG: glycosyl hydrolase 53 family protein [Bacteroidetes bacterium]|nr:glycosyl hydrolase 53 family protein [Bacteroidota bacterium]